MTATKLKIEDHEAGIRRVNEQISGLQDEMRGLKQEVDSHEREAKDAIREKEAMNRAKSTKERDLRSTQTALNKLLGEVKVGEKSK